MILIIRQCFIGPAGGGGQQVLNLSVLNVDIHEVIQLVGWIDEPPPLDQIFHFRSPPKSR